MLLNNAHNLLSSMKCHSYSNEAFVDVDNGIYRFNCASFIIYLLSTVGVNLKSKRACELFEEIGDYSEMIIDLNDVKPGDIVIWKKTVIPKKGDSGHIAIINDISKNRLQLIDCVKEIHDRDTREASGIGMGWIELLMRENKISGFRWLGHSTKTKFTEVRIYRLNRVL